MDIERIPEWALLPADEAAIAALMMQAFDPSFDGRSYHKQRHHLRLIVRVDGQIAGHMAIVWRAVRLGGALVTVAGLAEVATCAEYQGRGIASALLQAAIAETRASIAAHFVLFGDKPMYAAAGFAPMKNPMRWVGMDGAVTGEIRDGRAESLMVLPLCGLAWDGDADLDLLGPLF